MKFDTWMRKFQSHNSEIKKFLHYYDGVADLVYCRNGESILKYLMDHQVHDDLIKEFKIVWEQYEQSGMMTIKLQQRVKVRV